ncbi:MAG: hypothetical protein QNK37_27400 [Acidobacteriota bacterium]|nr:hypothetical protein [Acidobacteriota bacterium]
MSIVTLLNRVRDARDHPHPFRDREAAVCRCYLIGLAMQAYADGRLDKEEENLLMELARALGLSREQAHDILAEGRNADEETVIRIRDTLIDSRFKYYFILDLQIMAHQDSQLHPKEELALDRFRELLEIGEEDTAFLVQLADMVMEDNPEARERWAHDFFAKKKCRNNLEPDDFAHYLQE